MASEHCAHGLRADEDCEDCRQCLFDAHGWPQDWREARAWQAFRDFLNGTPEQWQAHSMAALERGYAMREHKR